MTERRIAVVAVRVVALLIAFQGVRDLLHVAEFVLGVSGLELDAVFASGVVGSALVVLVGIGMWLQADALAARALGVPRLPQEQLDAAAAEEHLRADVSGLDLHAVAFSVLGAYLLSLGFTRLALAVGQWLANLRPEFSSGQGEGVAFSIPTFEPGTTAIAAGAFLIVGFVLAFGARRLAAFFRRHWWAGRGVARVRRVEVVDFTDAVRARLGPEERPDGNEDVALTLFDEDGIPRAKLVIEDDDDPVLTFSDAEGRATHRVPALPSTTAED